MLVLPRVTVGRKTVIKRSGGCPGVRARFVSRKTRKRHKIRSFFRFYTVAYRSNTVYSACKRVFAVFTTHVHWRAYENVAFCVPRTQVCRRATKTAAEFGRRKRTHDSTTPLSSSFAESFHDKKKPSAFKRVPVLCKTQLYGLHTALITSRHTWRGFRTEAIREYFFLRGNDTVAVGRRSTPLVCSLPTGADNRLAPWPTRPKRIISTFRT